MKGLRHLLQVELFICHVIFISYECWSYFKQLPSPIDYSITLLVSEHVAVFLLLSHKSYSSRGVASLGSDRRGGYCVIWSTQAPVCDNNTNTLISHAQMQWCWSRTASRGAAWPGRDARRFPADAKRHFAELNHHCEPTARWISLKCSHLRVNLVSLSKVNTGKNITLG